MFSLYILKRAALDLSLERLPTSQPLGMFVGTRGQKQDPSLSVLTPDTAGLEYSSEDMTAPCLKPSG